ncbi:hypothetical protein MASR2M70_06370 [Bacillota bacterium]
MAIAREKIQGIINDLPEEKLGKVLSYINYIKDEEEPILVLEEDDESEIAKILEENEWYTSEEVKGAIEDMKHD